MVTKDDKHFVDKVKNGHSEAYRYLVERHKQMVFSIVVRIVQNNEDAEEISQDVFIKAYNSIVSFKGNSKFSTWLYRIAYNMAISHTRKKKYDTINLEENSISDDEIFETFNDFNNYEDAEKKSIIKETLEKLNEDERLLIQFYYLQEMSIKEIEKITDLSQSNIKVKLYRARNKLFSLLSDKKDIIFAV